MKMDALLQLRLPANEKDALKAIAETQGCSISQLVRNIIKSSKTLSNG